MKQYPSYDEIGTARLAARREAVLRTLRRVDELARALGGRAVAFGSLVEGGFDETSDLDVAIFGVPAGPDAELAVEIDTVIRAAGFSADVVPERFLPPSLKERILRNGKEQGALG
jgi:predicted nucleotidyltransferase